MVVSYRLSIVTVALSVTIRLNEASDYAALTADGRAFHASAALYRPALNNASQVATTGVML